MWIRYKEFSGDSTISLAHVSKIEVGNNGVYFFGQSCADGDGEIYPQLIDFVEFKSKSFAANCFNDIMAGIETDAKVYQIPTEWILEESEYQSITPSAN